MSTRLQLEAELDHLAQMLPVWREKLRQEAQFWPQFSALSGEILAGADPADREYVLQRIADMLSRNGLRPDGSPLP